jgi:hypothetical protein
MAKKVFRMPKETPPQQVADMAPAGKVDTPSEKETTRVVTEQDLKTLTEHQQAGVLAGNIMARWDEVEVSDKASPTGKGAKRPYIRLDALNGAGLAQMFDGKIEPMTLKPEEGEDKRTAQQKEKGACDYTNYGYDLERRAAARLALMNELEGPEKLVKKAVVGMLGIGMEPVEVKTTILNSPKFKGVDGLAKLIDAALRS